MMATLKVNPVNGKIVLAEARKYLAPLNTYALDIRMQYCAGKQVYADVVKLKLSNVL